MRGPLAALSRKSPRAPVIAAVLFLGLRHALAMTPADTRVGEEAPPYEARALGADTRASLESLRGKVILLNTWATWCGPCLKELPAFRKVHDLHRAAGLVVVAVNIDEGTSDERVRQYARGLKLPFPIWRDPNNRISRVFAVHGVPETFLIDRGGKIVHHWSGPMDPASPENARLISSALKLPEDLQSR
jgi:cytochrome c-type biogenesis protein